MAVTKLFSSCKRSNAHMGDFGSNVRFMKNIPSESQMQVVCIFCVMPYLAKCPPVEANTLLVGCCTRGPKSSSIWQKERCSSVCSGRSIVGARSHTCFTTW